ncbi:MAG: hypothetical protein RIR26_381 [Pseudomonadota bacterium]|jgi:hypothetical protein
MRFSMFQCTKMIFYSFLFFPIISRAQTHGQWTPGQCGDDGQCSLISISLEVEQKSPQNHGGVVIGTIDDDGFKSSGSNSTSAKKTCRKEVRVPRVVYDAVTQMFNGIVSRGNGVSLQPAFSPAEQTMLLYYNTIMQQTMNFQCNN